MTEAIDLSEELEVLKSIYPELVIDHDSLSLEINLNPEYHELEVVQLESETKMVLQSFKTSYLESLKFVARLPVMGEESVELKSLFVDNEVLSMMKSKITTMINNSIEADMQDSLLYTIIDYITVNLPQEFFDLVFADSKVKTTSSVLYNRLIEMSHELRLLKFEQERLTCSICLESYDGIAGILLDCDHRFCKPCFKEYAIRMINSDDVTKLQCPDCPFHKLTNLQDKSSAELKKILFTPKVNINILSQVLDADLIKKYESQSHELLFEKYSQYFLFSTSKCPRCLRFGFRDDVNDNLVICEYCKLAYCFECNHSWHGTINHCGSKLNAIPIDILEEMLDGPSESRALKLSQIYGRRALKFAVDQFVSEKLFRQAVANDEDMMSCPTCLAVVTKSDGCNTMTCTVCFTDFCYLCGDLLDHRPYMHFTMLGSPCYEMLFEGMPGTEDLE